MHTKILSSLAFLALASTTVAQWNQQSPATSPSARSQPQMTFESTNNQVVLFGGIGGGLGTPSNDMWTYDGTNWTDITPSPLPASWPGVRGQGGMVYDQNRGVVVMYGGGNTSFFGGPSIDETWEWSPVTGTWNQVISVNTPGGLANFGMAYDQSRNRIVVYGGTPDSFFPIASGATWEYDGLNWTQITTANSPGPLERPGMCYHAGLGKVVLFGGIDPQTGGTDQTWTYDGTDWTLVSTPSPRPSARAFGSMVYDANRGVAILYEGMDPTNGNAIDDTWEFDGTHWIQVNNVPSTPRRAYGYAMDDNRRRAVVFGGLPFGGFNPLGDTWEYGASYEIFGNGCAGNNGVPTLSANGVPRIGSTFSVTVSNLATTSQFFMMATGFSDTTWGGSVLPLDLVVYGMPGCTAFVSGDLFEVLPYDTGSNSTGTWSVNIRPGSHMIGLTFFNQAVSIDLLANPAGLVVSDAGKGVIGG